MNPPPPPPPPEEKSAANQSNSDHSREGDRPVLSVIRDIQRGEVNPKSLPIDDRRRCVEHLTGEGYSVAEIAEILKVTERTIARDRATIQEANAIERDPKLTGEMVGQLITQAETGIHRIRRVTRERNTPPAVRIDGEKACWVIARDLVQRLQSLGYLPTTPMEIRGELRHQVQQLPGFGHMKEEVARLEVIVNSHVIGDDERPLLEKLAEIKDQVMRGALHEEITAIEQRLAGDGEESDGRNE